MTGPPPDQPQQFRLGLREPGRIERATGRPAQLAAKPADHTEQLGGYVRACFHPAHNTSVTELFIGPNGAATRGAVTW